MTPEGMPTTTDMTRTDLEARQALALEAAEGTPGAAAKLEAVEGELAALQPATERATLAEQARAARAQAEAAAREAARRREAEEAWPAWAPGGSSWRTPWIWRRIGSWGPCGTSSRSPTRCTS